MWDWPEPNPYLRLISETITQPIDNNNTALKSLPFSLSLFISLNFLSSFPPSLCFLSPLLHPCSLPLAFSPLYLFLTVGQVSKMPEHFTQWYPFTPRSAHNDFKLSIMAHNRHFYPTPAGISNAHCILMFFWRQKLWVCVCVFILYVYTSQFCGYIL